MRKNNLFDGIPEKLPHEIFHELIYTESFKLERIVSGGQSTPPGEWYDQEWHEWVILLSGSAGISFEGQPSILELKPGDYIKIKAHQKHRVEWTNPEEKTIWLALHYIKRGKNATYL